MLMYAVVLIVVMLCTWSPIVKEKIDVVNHKLKKLMRKNKKGGQKA